MSIIDEKSFNTTGIHIKDAFVVIVKTTWNSHVVDLLEEGCIKELEKNNVSYQVIEVPGAVEIPFVINQYYCHSKKKADAFIALGCVIRGGTPHFEYVCQLVTDGISRLSITLDVPVIFGILTVDNQVQADERTGGRNGHKGEEAAITAIKMIDINQSIKNT